SSGPESRAALPAFLDDPDPTIRLAAIQWVGEQRLAEFRRLLVDGLASGAVTRALFKGTIAALGRLGGGARESPHEIPGEDYIAKLLNDSSVSPAVRRRALRTLRPDHPALTVARLREILASDDLDTQLEAARSLRDNPDPRRIETLSTLARDRSAAP